MDSNEGAATSTTPPADAVEAASTAASHKSKKKTVVVKKVRRKSGGKSKTKPSVASSLATESSTPSPLPPDVGPPLQPLALAAGSRVPVHELVAKFDGDAAPVGYVSPRKSAHRGSPKSKALRVSPEPPLHVSESSGALVPQQWSAKRQSVPASPPVLLDAGDDGSVSPRAAAEAAAVIAAARKRNSTSKLLATTSKHPGLPPPRAARLHNDAESTFSDMSVSSSAKHAQAANKGVTKVHKHLTEVISRGAGGFSKKLYAKYAAHAMTVAVDVAMASMTSHAPRLEALGHNMRTSELEAVADAVVRRRSPSPRRRPMPMPAMAAPAPARGSYGVAMAAPAPAPVSPRRVSNARPSRASWVKPTAVSPSKSRSKSPSKTRRSKSQTRLRQLRAAGVAGVAAPAMSVAPAMVSPRKLSPKEKKKKLKETLTQLAGAPSSPRAWR